MAITLSRVTVSGQKLPAVLVTSNDKPVAYVYTGNADDNELFVHTVGKEGTISDVAQVVDSVSDLFSMLEKGGL